MSPSSTDSGRSDGDAEESSEEGGSSIMLDKALDLLSRRWDRINGAQALRLLPRETKLQVSILLLRGIANFQSPTVFTFCLWFLKLDLLFTSL